MLINPVLSTDFITPLEPLIKSSDVSELNDSTGENFLDTLKSAIGNVKELEKQAEQGSYDLSMGYTDDLEGIMIQSAKATTAIELTTQLVTRAVNAYKEIIQMQL